MRERMPPDDVPLEREDLEVLRLLRAAMRRNEGSMNLPSEESLAAYVAGTATDAQSAEVRAAMLRSSALRRHVLELMQTAARGSTPEEREAFGRATPPRLEEFPELHRLMREAVAKEPAHRIAPRGARRWGGLEWAIGGWAAAATAACAALVAVRGLQPPPAPPPPSTSQQPPAPAYALDAAQPVFLHSATRGEEEGIPVIAVAPGLRAIELKAEPPPGLADSASVRVTVSGPGGVGLIDETRRVGDLFDGTFLVLRSPTSFQPGKYELTISGMNLPIPREAYYPFTIEIRAP